MRKLLNTGISLIREVIADVESYTDDKTFAMERSNFPVTGEIYRDPDLRMVGLDSYYLHNKLLMADTMIKDINRVIRDMKSDFEDRIQLNELMISNTDVKPRDQRKMYGQNLKVFSDGIAAYMTNQFPVALKMLMQIKIYNGYLRAKRLF